MATDFNVLYDVRDSLKILMAVCCVHIFFEIRVFKNINFVSCDSCDSCDSRTIVISDTFS